MITYSTLHRLRGLRQEESMNYRVDEAPVASNVVETTGLANGDLIYTGETNSGFRNDADVVVLDSPVYPGHSFSALNPEIATIDETGHITVVTPTSGYATFEIVTRGGSRSFTRYCANSNSTSYTAKATDYAAGSLNKHLLSQVSSLVSGKTPGDATQKLWTISSSSIDAPAGEMNAGNFAAAYNWNACSMLTSGRTDDRFPLTLISDRHAVTANHIAPAVGSKAVYKRPDGTYQTVTVSKSDLLASQDLRLVCFDTAITGITPYKLPPVGWVETYVPSALSSPAPYVPTCQSPLLIKGMHDQNGKWKSYVGVFGASAIAYTPGLYAVISPQPSQHTALSAWTPMAFIGGDSGSPAFLPVNGELVLLGVVVSSLGGFSRMYGADVEAVLADLMTSQAGSAYAPTYANFSGFASYP